MSPFAKGASPPKRAVEIVTEKDERAYRRILERRGVAPEGFVMIGNSARSDVQPILALVSVLGARRLVSRLPSLAIGLVCVAVLPFVGQDIAADEQIATLGGSD